MRTKNGTYSKQDSEAGVYCIGGRECLQKTVRDLKHPISAF